MEIQFYFFYSTKIPLDVNNPINRMFFAKILYLEFINYYSSIIRMKDFFDNCLIHLCFPIHLFSLFIPVKKRCQDILVSSPSFLAFFYSKF